MTSRQTFVDRIEDIERMMRECEDTMQLKVLQARFDVLRWLHSNQGDDADEGVTTLNEKLGEKK